jgi:sugar O-acyltransferase (sialic acid O-acetyltransferase NeuD family)
VTRLAILGASGHGKVVADTALAAGYDAVVFFDDAYPARSRVHPWTVSGTSRDLLARVKEFDGILVGIGDNDTRWRKHVSLREAGGAMAVLVHPRAWVSPNALLGAGTVVVGGAVVNIGARLGEANIVNTGATVDHDCELENAVHVCPGANLSGNVSVGSGAWVGVAACVRQGIRIGANAIVGAGAVVVAPVADGLTVAGCPARQLMKTNVT